MNKYIYYKNTTGEIASVVQYEYQIDPVNVEGQSYIEVPAETLNNVVETHYVADGVLVEKAPRPTDSSFYVWSPNTWAFDADAFLAVVRRDRNKRLSATDWTQVADAPLTEEQVSAYRTYRQALRDITDNLDGTERLLTDISWPTL
jgi:hypothetical protein